MWFLKYASFGQWRWRLYAANNEIVANGEAYHNEADCDHAIALVKASYNAPIYRRAA